MSLMQSN